MRKLCMNCIACVCSVVLMLMVSMPPVAFAASAEAPANVLISELQTGGLDIQGNENGRIEFVELYNPSDSILNVTGWRVEYLSASHNGTGPPTRVLATLEGAIQPHMYALLGYEGIIANADALFGAGSTSASGLLARGGGHVRIVNTPGDTMDLVGWGAGVAVGNWPHVPEIPAGQSVQRHITEGLSAEKQGFAPPSSLITPQGGGLNVIVPPDDTEPDPEYGRACGSLVFTEFLPNPDGVDTGKEYIELYNPTDQAVRMLGCGIRLGEDGRMFQLPDELLPPHAYRAFLDGESGLTLPNNAGSTVWLVSADNELGVAYPGGLQGGQAWAVQDGVWLRTMKPTPGLANLVPPETEKTTAETDLSLSTSLASCPAGKERNPATNRCRNIALPAVGPAPCKAGTVRNPATNRCRSVLTASTLAACKPGQQRNAETNRCRSVLGQTTATKPCAAGYERNPQTNRCRKTQPGGKSMASIQDVRTNGGGLDERWVIAGVVMVGAISYALYEWRQEFSLLAQRLVRRIRPGRRGG